MSATVIPIASTAATAPCPAEDWAFAAGIVATRARKSQTAANIRESWRCDGVMGCNGIYVKVVMASPYPSLLVVVVVVEFFKTDYDYDYDYEPNNRRSLHRLDIVHQRV